ncbi:hypothetical protein ACLOJK_018113 [Asimina triloba]
MTPVTGLGLSAAADACDFVFLTSVVGNAIVRRQQRHPLPFPEPFLFIVPIVTAASAPIFLTSVTGSAPHLPSSSAAPSSSHCQPFPPSALPPIFLTSVAGSAVDFSVVDHPPQRRRLPICFAESSPSSSSIPLLCIAGRRQARRQPPSSPSGICGGVL